MPDAALNALAQEIDSTSASCVVLLEQVRLFCPPDLSGEYPETFRIMATPIFYSIWERSFRIANSIGLKAIRHKMRTPTGCTESQIAMWLQKESFYTSFLDRLHSSKAAGDAERSKVGKGAFDALSKFLEEYKSWLVRPIPPGHLNDYVMTFSNVNRAVVAFNAAALGVDQFPAYQTAFRGWGRLDDLVGRRNDIGHGTLAIVPGNKEFGELFQFTYDLVGSYCRVYSDWVRSL